MSDKLYTSIHKSMSDEQHNIMCQLYLKGINRDGHTWCTYTDIENAVANIILLERKRNE